MIQFLRLIDENTIVYPPELVSLEKVAKSMWGLEKYVSRNIEKTEDPATFADKLADGQVVVSEQRKQEAEAFNKELRDTRRDNKKTFRRTAAIEKLKKNIDSNKSYDELTQLEKKLIFNIDGGATDRELGVT